MAHVKKVTSTLSLAATVLLEACSSASTESGPAAVPNTTAPQLIATWQTSCIITQNSGTTTTTQASGGGGGSVSGGAAYRTSAIFNQDGRVELFNEIYATSNCNPNTLSSLNRYNAVYYIGGSGLANDGSQVTEVNFNDGSSTTYSIFQVINSTDLYMGDATTSTPGNDGSSETTRYDGLGPRMLK